MGFVGRSVPRLEDLPLVTGNGRFAAELKAKEKQIGHQLDPLAVDDQEILRDLLLGLDPQASHLLKEDLKKGR